MKLEQVYGTWRLVRFDLEDLEGQLRPWGTNTHGLLIYSPSGYMSVSINKDIEPSEDGEYSDTLDSILFYSGTYAADGDIIKHQVTEASNPNRIGKEMIRYAKRDGELLELATPKESFGRAILVWKMVAS
ncbi:MAG: hypothetical protein RJB38_1337 [Pseudomonadota bacterium]|jgi:hypothetical protein